MSLKWQLMNCWGKMIKMTKNEYICELYEGLKELDGKIVDDVIDDVEEYFMEGKARGLSEEEVIKELGPASDFVSGLLNQERELSSSRLLRQMSISMFLTMRPERLRLMAQITFL